MKRIFRFDDICVNTNMDNANSIADFIRKTFKNCELIFCISPLVHDLSMETGESKERIFPKILKAMSDHRCFYKVDTCGIPDIPPYVTRGSHGLVHVDHRLLNRSAQEMSILTSCSLAKTDIFVPPFNKWNKYTEEICEANNITLFKFEDGWLSMEHNPYDHNHYKWYLHSRAFTLEKMKNWFKEGGIVQQA